MSQYFYIVNQTKKQFLLNHEVGPLHGVNWGEIVFDRVGVLQLFAILISTNMTYGERRAPSFTGGWIGDRVLLMGDNSHEYEAANGLDDFEDITSRLLNELDSDHFWKERFERNLRIVEAVRDPAGQIE